MPRSISDPSPEDLGSKAVSSQSNSIVKVVSEQLLLRVLVVEKSKPHNGNCCEHNVVALVDPRLVEGLATENRKKAKPEHGEHEQHVLVEVVADKERVATISFSTVNKEELAEELELTNDEISRPCSLLAFEA